MSKVSVNHYSERRKRLGKAPGLYVFTAHDALQQNADQAYPFMQDTNFLYLTGISEPGWILVVNSERTNYSEYLIAPTISDTKRIFDGALEWTSVQQTSGVSRIYSVQEGWKQLEGLIDVSKKVFTIKKHPHQAHYEFTVNPAQARLVRRLKKYGAQVEDCRRAIARARAIKSPTEIAAIREAVAHTVAGFEEVKQSLQDMSYEYEVEAILNAAFRKRGANGHAYQPIVAGGKNACTLHYVHNNEALPALGLLLIDAGARADGYAADITRTYAIGQVSKRHQQVHAAVEQAHIAIIGLLKPGLKVMDYQKAVDDIMSDALKSLGLLKTRQDVRKYFPHAISHGLGLDVHDSLGAPEAFEPGMVLTVEPGIYIPDEHIGVRIEDDILITESGAENLSAALSTSL